MRLADVGLIPGVTCILVTGVTCMSHWWGHEVVWLKLLQKKSHQTRGCVQSHTVCCLTDF